MSLLAMLGAGGSAPKKTYIEDVFGTTLYTGTGSAQTISGLPALADSPVTQAFSAFAFRSTGAGTRITGMDLASGSLVWVKSRGSVSSHVFVDTVRGAPNTLYSDSTGAQATSSTITGFTNNGFTTGLPNNSTDYIAWCFAKKAKFMDIQVGTAGGMWNTVPVTHNLGMLPGMILIKNLSRARDWLVYHRSIGSNKHLLLNTTAAQTDFSNWINVTDTTIEFGTATEYANDQYVFYIFAHDTATDGMIQCGSYVGNGGTLPVTLGWKAQYVLVKPASAVGNWEIYDTTRGVGGSGVNDALLLANTSGAEDATADRIAFGATSFSAIGSGNPNASGTTYIYMAIRAPETSSTGGGLVWTKCRSSASYSHLLVDTVRGSDKSLSTTTTAAQTGSNITAFSGAGYSIDAFAGSNQSGQTYWSITFKRTKKFFDIVSWTGNDDNSRRIPHSLEVIPGFIIVKTVSGSGDWGIYHRGGGTGFTYHTGMTLTSAAVSAGGSGSGPTFLPTATDFAIATCTGTSLVNPNQSGVQYVAYVFAHDPSADGMIQCGSYTAASGDTTVTLGWEPQFLLIRRTNTSSDWYMMDSMLGMSHTGTSLLRTNSTNGEEVVAAGYFKPTATGFIMPSGLFNTNDNIIYMAIRRGPMKPPTSGTQVYNAVARTGTGTTATISGAGFPPDLLIEKGRTGGYGTVFVDKLRGRASNLFANGTSAEAVSGAGVDIVSFDMDGITAGAPSQSIANASGVTEIDWFFRRYPQVFDIVCYTGTGSARTVPHNLGVAPELMIVKIRDTFSAPWATYVQSLGNDKYLTLDSTNSAAVAGTMWNLTSPTSTVFTTGTNATVNSNGAKYVAYLFATKAGISKVGSYVGNGTSQTIDCGFAAGARFVLLKQTGVEKWTVYDSVRGITSANDPTLALNGTAAEVTETSNALAPAAQGFVVNTNSDLTNSSGVTYIYLAFA